MQTSRGQATTLRPDWLTRNSLWLLGVALLVPNLIGSAVNIGYNLIHIQPLLTADQERAFSRTILVYNVAVYPVAVYVWLWCVLSLRPSFRRLLDDGAVAAEPLAAARRRVINLPWYGSAVAAVCWFLCIPVFLVAMTAVAGPLDERLYWHLPISFLISGLMAITHGFFAVEITGQRLLFPVFFRDARPANTPGTLPLTLRVRGLIWAISAGVCPIASLVLLNLAPHDASRSSVWFPIAVGGIGIAFGMTTAWLVGMLVADPVVALRQAAQAVAAGDRDVHIPLLHADEFGPLIDEFNQMVAELGEKERLQQTFGLHVGHEAARQIMQRDPGLGGVDEEITVAFVDIRNFTARTAACSPAQTVGMLNMFLTEMVEVVEDRHGGMVNKFLGDGFMALFGAGGTHPDHADAATAAGREMLARLTDLNRRLGEHGHAPLQIGVGIHSGRAVVGSIGSPSRMEFTAIGDTVNVAARVEALTKLVGEPLLLTAATSALLRSSPPTEELPPQEVKGKALPLRICRVVG